MHSASGLESRGDVFPGDEPFGEWKEDIHIFAAVIKAGFSTILRQFLTLNIQAKKSCGTNYLLYCPKIV